MKHATYMKKIIKYLNYTKEKNYATEIYNTQNKNSVLKMSLAAFYISFY